MLSPKCRRVLSSTLIGHGQIEPQTIDVVSTQAVDMSAPSVEGEIEDYFILEVLVDGVLVSIS